MATAFKIIQAPGSRGYAQSAARSLQRLAQSGPRVHCITNSVAMDLSSDVLLAVGAQASMSMGMEEISEFVASASTLSINIGMLDSTRRAVIRLAIETALDFSKPWILDPVAVHASEKRCAYALELMALQPTVIRGNFAEIHTLAGDSSTRAAQTLARQTGAVVVQSGEADLVTDGNRALLIANGDAMQTRVSAMGCAASALIAGFMAVESDPFDAAVEAMLVLGVAAENAMTQARGPGSFHMYLLDALYAMNEQVLQAQGHVVRCVESSGED